MNPIKRLHSPSSILTYKHGPGFRWGCPRKYWLRYIKKVKTRQTPELLTGNLIHAALEKFTNLYTPKMLDQEYGTVRKIALEQFQNLWQENLNRIQSVSGPEKNIEQLEVGARAMIITWLHQFLKEMSTGRSPPTTETRIVNRALGVQGIIDAVYNDNGTVEIRDYKTGKHDDVTPEIRLQLALYSLLYKEQFGVTPETVSIHFLRFPNSNSNPKAFKPTPESLQWAEREIRLIHRLTRSDRESDYPCVCGGRCQKEFIR